MNITFLEGIKRFLPCNKFRLTTEKALHEHFLKGKESSSIYKTDAPQKFVSMIKDLTDRIWIVVTSLNFLQSRQRRRIRLLSPGQHGPLSTLWQMTKIPTDWRNKISTLHNLLQLLNHFLTSPNKNKALCPRPHCCSRRNSSNASATSPSNSSTAGDHLNKKTLKTIWRARLRFCLLELPLLVATSLEHAKFLTAWQSKLYRICHVSPPYIK